MVRNLLVTFWLVLMAGCATIKPHPQEHVVLSKVVEVPGVSKEDIYKRSKLWIARNFKPFKAVWLYRGRTAPVLEYASESEGILIATGSIFYPNGYKNYWEVTFTMEEDIKDSRVRVTFTNLSYYVPEFWCHNRYGGWLGAYDKPLTGTEDVAAVRPVLLGLADRLGEYLRATENEVNW